MKSFIKNNLFGILLIICLIQNIKGADKTVPADGEFPNQERINVQGNYVIEFEYKKLTDFKYLNFLAEDLSTDSTKRKDNIALSFSNTENLEEREQLAEKDETENTEMWIDKAQITGNKYYITISCVSCEISFTVTESSAVQMSLEKQLRFYITPSITSITFEFSFNNTDYDMITVWFRGGKTLEYKIIGNLDKEVTKDNRYSYTNREAFNIKLNEMKTDSYKEFFLTGSFSEYDMVNIGTTGFKNQRLIKPIESNKREVIALVNLKTPYLCFPYNPNDEALSDTKVTFLNGRVYEKYADSFLLSNGEKVPDSNEFIEDGQILYGLFKSSNHYDYCVGIPQEKQKQDYNVSEMFISLQIVSQTTAGKNRNYYSPQVFSKFIDRVLLENETGYYYGLEIEKSAKETTFYLNRRAGFPSMYFYTECKTFPICDYTTHGSAVKLQNTHRASFEMFKAEEGKKYNAISLNQLFILVECSNGASKKEKQDKTEKVCAFQTGIFSDIDSVELKEGQSISRYVTAENPINDYRINFDNQVNAAYIYIDIMIYAGDIKFNEQEGVAKTEIIYEGNKMFALVEIDPESEIREYRFQLEGKLNSFYYLEYNIVLNGKKDESVIANIEFDSGLSYLVTVDRLRQDSTGKTTPYKTVNFRNPRKAESFLVNFDSLNCEAKIKRRTSGGNVTLESYGKFHQDLITKDDPYYGDELHSYILEVSSQEKSVNNRICLVYASALELNTEGYTIEKQIVVSDNIAQQAIFKKGKFEKIKYLYPYTNTIKNIIWSFISPDRARFKYYIYINGVDIFNGQGQEIISSAIKFQPASDFKEYGCKENRLCNYIIKIEWDVANSPSDVNDARILIEFKSLEDFAPKYLAKNRLQSDFLHGDVIRYFYSDIDLDEIGEITLNMIRGNSNIYARLVAKDQKFPDAEAEWRGMYKFPYTRNESLYYDGYLKKIIYTPMQTEICAKGCYLLITVVASYSAQETSHYVDYPFTIIVRNNPAITTYKDIMPMDIAPEVYVVGNVGITGDENVYEFYLLSIYRNSESIYIDFQSDYCGIYVGISKERRPTKQVADFKFEQGESNKVIRITRDELLAKAKEKQIPLPVENSIKGMNLVIGIFSNVTSSIYTSPYLFNVHAPLYEEEELRVYPVVGDQGVRCKTIKISESSYGYRCLYLVLYRNIDSFQKLLIYPTLEDQKANFKMHVNSIDKETYYLNMYNDLKNQIPTETYNEYTTTKTGEDFLLISGILNKKDHLLVSIETTAETTVTFYSSFYDNELVVTPNPTSPQIFSVRGEKIKFKFQTSDDLLVSFLSISGKGHVYWETEENAKYYLSGRDDRLSLTNRVISDEQDKIYSDLQIVNEKYNPEEKEDIRDLNPGFAFLVSYQLRTTSKNFNFDQLPIGKSYTFAYREGGLPIYLYTRIYEWQDTNIFINFYDLIEKNKRIVDMLEANQIQITAFVCKEAEIFEAKQKGPGFVPSSNRTAIGTYDASKKAAFLFMSKYRLMFNLITLAEKPCIFIAIRQKDSLNTKLEFTRITFQATVNQPITMIPVNEKSYQFGKLGDDPNSYVYSLRKNKNKKYMGLEFSANSENIKWCYSKQPNCTKNDTFKDFESNYQNGRTLVLFSTEEVTDENIYLTVSRINNSTEIYNRNNYVFQHFCAENKSMFINYKIEDPKIKVEKTISEIDIYGQKIKIRTFNIEFNKLNADRTKVEIDYLIRFTPKRYLDPKENQDSIAITEQESLVYDYYNPEPDENGKIKLEIKNVTLNVKAIEIICQYNEGTLNGLLAYSTTILPDEQEDKGDGNSNNLGIIIPCVVVGVLILGALIAVIIICSKKNKDLLKKVQQTSFQVSDTDENRNEDENLLVG